MLNAFDFYVLEFVSPRKRELKAAGLKHIEKVFCGYKSFGSKRYPTWLYRAFFGTVDAQRAAVELEQSKAEMELLCVKYGLKGHIRYVCRD